MEVKIKIIVNPIYKNKKENQKYKSGLKCIYYIIRLMEVAIKSLFCFCSEKNCDSMV